MKLGYRTCIFFLISKISLGSVISCFIFKPQYSVDSLASCLSMYNDTLNGFLQLLQRFLEVDSAVHPSEVDKMSTRDF